MTTNCEHCNSSISADDKFCGNCGTPVASGEVRRTRKLTLDPKVLAHNLSKDKGDQEHKEYGKALAQGAADNLIAQQQQPNSAFQPPKREDFKTQQEFEEAKGFYHSRIGRLSKMAGVT